MSAWRRRTAGATIAMRINTVAMMKARLIGRVTNTEGSPFDISIARRRFSSIIGPSTKPSSIGAGEKPSRSHRKPAMLNAAVR